MQNHSFTPLIGALLASALAISPALAQTKKTSSASGLESEVVGSINGKPIYTFGQFIAKVQRDNPPAFSAAVSSALGPKALATLFGPKAKSEFTVTKKELLTLLRNNPSSLGQQLGAYLSAEAVQMAGVKAGAVPSETQLNEFINYVLRQTRKDPQSGFTEKMTDDEFLKKNNMTRAKIKGNFRDRVMLLNLIQKETEKQLAHSITPNDFVQARHILIKANAITAESKPEDKKADADALAKITQIETDIRSGKLKFEDAAKQFSEDGSKDQGGDLGVFMDDKTMVAEFEKAAFALKSNEVSKPVRSQFGYHLIQVTKTGKELTDDDRLTAIIRKNSQKMAGFQAQLAHDAKIENKLQPAQNIPMNFQGQ